MTDKGITELSDGTPLTTDIVPYVSDPDGSPETKKTTVANLTSSAWPVGSVFIAVVSTDPAVLLGYGVWSSFGAGKVLVGIDSGDADFDTAEETGGEKEHELTEAENGEHTHIQDAHLHTIPFSNWADAGGNVGSRAYYSGTTNTSSVVAINQNSGSGTAHNNLQPYIVVYMWKRTA